MIQYHAKEELHMKKGLMTLLIIMLVLITAFVACSGNARTSNRSGTSSAEWS